MVSPLMYDGKAIPFTDAENNRLVELYIENYHDYHATFGASSRQCLATQQRTPITPRQKERLATEWANELATIGPCKRTTAQIKQKILGMRKLAKAYLAELNEYTRTGKRRRAVFDNDYVGVLAKFLATVETTPMPGDLERDPMLENVNGLISGRGFVEEITVGSDLSLDDVLYEPPEKKSLLDIVASVAELPKTENCLLDVPTPSVNSARTASVTSNSNENDADDEIMRKEILATELRIARIREQNEKTRLEHSRMLLRNEQMRGIILERQLEQSNSSRSDSPGLVANIEKLISSDS